MRFPSEGNQFLRDGDHLASPFELVVSRGDAKLHLVGHTRQVLPGLSELRSAGAEDCAFSSTVENVVGESNSDRAEVARQKWHVVLKTVPREGLDIRNKVVAGQANGR